MNSLDLFTAAQESSTAERERLRAEVARLKARVVVAEAERDRARRVIDALLSGAPSSPGDIQVLLHGTDDWPTIREAAQ